MNAKGAKWYAFWHNGNELISGEFVWASEGVPTIEKFNGYVILATGKIKEVKNVEYPKRKKIRKNSK